ncbi:hypothetical protein EET67_00030 [Pseudaminobacter arsenicus]|uniref:Flagellar biosynthesis protein FliO n=1 Tax=Borborobacter arsenicus TaxID=1851146 RepID=A0A432VCH5_9HYPH|nr:flagellar biosynthetic protein FliO [Pseudaminobacter arsenicus]RUM99880.1 hypothetical protein EET67_00030 [Pseudaminobacter arsenicus]
MDWLDGIAGPGYSAAILWTFAALILLLVVLVIIKLVRSLTFGTFVAGGRNRKARLAVMDATAVDSNRRLVLVRRDDIEHLLLIGGASDIVVERDIRLTQHRRPVLSASDSHDVPTRTHAPEQPAQRPAPPLRAPAPTPRPAPAAVRPAPAFAPRPAPAPRAEPPVAPQATPAPVPHRGPSPVLAHTNPSPAAPQPTAERDKIDDELMKELEFSLRESPQAAASKAAEGSLDDEMTRLLGELSSHKR